MMQSNLFSCIFDRLRSSENVAIELDDGRVVTYRQMVELSGRMANALVRRGFSPGDRLAAQTEKSFEAVILYLATVRAGGVYLPLNTAYTLAEIEYFVLDAEPTIIVCDPARRTGFESIAEAVKARVETLDAAGRGTIADAVESESSEFQTVPRAPDDLAAILYTSGTTGRSKGAMLTQRNLVSNAETLIDAWRITEDDVLIHVLPIYHTHGLFVGCNSLFLAGARLIFKPKFDAEEVLGLMPRATMLMGVPTFYVRLLQSDALCSDVTRNIRLFISGSAPLLAETHRTWKQRTGHSILERYGMTETGMNTSNPCEGDRIAGSVGLPLPGVSIRIADPESGRILGADEIGVAEVKGPNVFKGYWRMPEKTAAEFRPDGFFITGDLARLDERGYLHIVGRGKDLIITGGFNVYPKEIETAIDAVDGVAESAVVGVPHADFGEGVTAVVVLKPGSTLDEQSILRTLSGKLAKFKLPKRVILAEKLPRNTMGKVQKNVLRDEFSKLYR